VVLENIMRTSTTAWGPLEATLQGSREISFTVLSMSLSLIAVFIPLLFMGGIVGRLFREFAVSLLGRRRHFAGRLAYDDARCSAPGCCTARRAGVTAGPTPGRSMPSRASSGVMTGAWAGALRHWIVTLAILLVTIGLNWYLFTIVPKGFFPQQDNGMMFAGIQASQSTSFQAMRRSWQTMPPSSAPIRASNRWSRSPAAADRPTRPACSSR
jgi:multidrug efflux pump